MKTSKIAGFFGNLRSFWKQPPKGRYMSFKEIISFSVGGIGQKCITYCINQMIISIGNVLIGNTIGINPSAMYVIYIISVLSGFPLTAVRAKMIDNTRSMKGKYRPYIISMGIPGMHSSGKYGKEGHFDGHGNPVQKGGYKFSYLKNKYFHTSYLIRSSAITGDYSIKWRRAKMRAPYDGRFSSDFQYPEVFYRKDRPTNVKNPFESDFNLIRKVYGTLTAALRFVYRKIVPYE